MVSTSNFTQEYELSNRYNKEIAQFWQLGEFHAFTGINNTRINYAAFRQQEHSRSLIISPGRCESYLKYKELIYDLYQNGYDIYIIDHRGQGKSARLLANKDKGYVESFDYYADDLYTFIKTVVNARVHNNENKPYLLAHSMGGAIAIRMFQRHNNVIKAAVLSSPLIAIHSSIVPVWLAQTVIIFSKILNQLLSKEPWYFLGQGNYQEKKFKDNALTQSKIRYQQCSDLYHKHPEIQLGGVTTHWLDEVIKTEQNIFNELKQVNLPITVIQAGADSVVDNKAQLNFCRKLHAINEHSCPNGKPFIVKDARHELFFEQDKYRNKAIRYTLDWFDEFSNNSSSK